MIEVVASVIAASVVGSMHCAAMCGGLVAFSTAGTEKGGRIGAIAAYNGTRGLGYVALGTLAGALGSTVDHAGLRIGVGHVAGAVAGIVMIVWGMARMLEAAGARLRWGARTPIHVPVANLIRRLRDEPPVVRSAVVGGCTAALPCGFLHAFLVLSAGMGSALPGAIVMGAFWLGTLPAVVGIGAGATLVMRPLRKHAGFVGALVLLGFGLTSLLGRWSPLSLVSPHLSDTSCSQAPDHVR